MKEIVFGTHDKRLELNKDIHPKPLKQVIPDYIKKIKLDKDFLNFKSCPSYIDVFKYGYALLAPTDILLEVTKDGVFKWEVAENFQVNKREFEWHFDEQFKNYTSIDKNIHKIVKYTYPFKVFTPKGYSCRQMPIPLEYNSDWQIFDGVLRTDKIHHINLQLIIKTNKRILIEQGTPLAAYVPFKREILTSKVINTNEKNKYAHKLNSEHLKYYGKFKSSYRNLGYFEE